MATPSVSANLGMPLVLPADVFKPVVVAERYRRHGDQFLPLYQILAGMGRWKMIADTTWYGFEDQDIHTTFINQNFVADPGVNNPATITLDPTSVETVSGTDFCYPRVRDEVLMPNLNIGWISAVNKLGAGVITLTILPKNGYTLGAINAGQELAIVSGSAAEGTGPVEGAVRNMRKKTFYLQLIKEKIGAEGGMFAQQVWNNVYADDGKTINGVTSELMYDLQYRMDLKTDGALWVGQSNTAGAGQITELGFAGFQNPVWSTDGLLRAAIAEGLQVPTSTIPWGTSAALTFFDGITTYLIQQHVPAGYIMFMMGVGLGNNLNNTLYNSNLFTSVDYTRMSETWFSEGAKNRDGKTMGMFIDFKQFGHNTGFDFVFRPMFNFNNPNTFGVPVYGFTDRGVMMPMTKVMNPKNKQLQNNIEFVYKGMGSYSRKFIVAKMSGAGEDMSATQTLNDWSETGVMGTVGLQAFACNQFVNIFK